MFPGMNPSMMKKAMKQMGIKQEEVDADEVIIKGSEKNIVIKNAQVTKINMQGNETFQISGDITEEAIEDNNEEDIKTIMDQTSSTKEEAEKALSEKGDLPDTILSLTK